MLNEVPRIVPTSTLTNAFNGSVYWQPTKSLWITSIYFIAIIGGMLTFSWQAFAVFVLWSAVTLCLGHSLGMHRLLIHRSYTCPIWLEYLLVHFGVLVGLAGPISMIKIHDMRDWAQRQKQCHDFFSQQQIWWKDAWWQLHCGIKLEQTPTFILEKRVANDPIYAWLEKTWMLQQIPWAILLFLCGGISWVVWGVFVRVAVSVTGHWFIGYLAHHHGKQDWYVDGAAVQGYNVSYTGLITMGESWHNNHHAFPGSALLGLYPGQMDPGWWVLNVLISLGLVWNVTLPKDLPARPVLRAISQRKTKIVTLQGCRILNFILFKHNL